MVKKDVKSKVAAELLLLKFLPLTYHPSHFLAATLDFFFHHGHLSEINDNITNTVTVNRLT